MNIIIIVLLYILVSGMVLNLYYLRRTHNVHTMLKELNKYTFDKSIEAINKGGTYHDQYYKLYGAKINQIKLTLDLRINLDEFKRDYIELLNKIDNDVKVL